MEELVQLMTPEDLEMQDVTWTALHLAARLNLKMVECMVTKNKNLLGFVEQSHGLTPILFAAKNDLWDIARYLYSLTPIQDLMPENGPYGAGLVCFCFYAKQFGKTLNQPRRTLFIYLFYTSNIGVGGLESGTFGAWRTVLKHVSYKPLVLFTTQAFNFHSSYFLQ